MGSFSLSFFNHQLKLNFKMFLGIDDTDSLKGGGCTTYLGAILCEKLKVLGYPKLIRLNPNIPFKTRGNGAISLEVREEDDEKIRRIVLDTVKKFSKFEDNNTNPGVVFLSDSDFRKNKKVLDNFYSKAVSELCTIEEADKVAKRVNAEIHKFKLGRGIVGALAAIGANLENDRTYELLAYRIPKNYGKEKKILKKSIFEMNEKTFPETFNNIDLETKRILIMPKGYDPVFCGIRGENPETVERAWKILKPLEKIERTQIFVTNQGTDAHLREKEISSLNRYDCVILEGKISKEPKTIVGGHVIFELDDKTGKIECAAYKPTGNFRDVVKKLSFDDKVKVFGCIGKYKKTVNLEKIQILNLEKKFRIKKPSCCGKIMTSAGKEKGYKCKKCGKKVRKIKTEEILRELKVGFYEVPPRAKRHLSMPLIRMKN